MDIIITVQCATRIITFCLVIGKNVTETIELIKLALLEVMF